MQQDKIVLAQKIVGNSLGNINSESAYHNTSFIYKKTNENISSYQHHLQNKDKILSVIASSNQILNSILEGTTNIDAFDISIFPEEYLKLHLAGILNLNKEDYFKFFYDSITTDEIYDDMYGEIRKDLDKDSKEFWDGLFNFYDWYEINDSTLFSNESVYKDELIYQNKYLQENNYDLLKDKIPKVNINFITGDILKLATTLPDSYDLVNLSSIVYYNKISDYINSVKQFNLTETGEVLTYLYEINDNIKNRFSELNPSYEQFTDKKSGVMIYKKTL